MFLSVCFPLDNVIGLQMKLSSFLDLTQSGNIEIVLQQVRHTLMNLYTKYRSNR